MKKFRSLSLWLCLSSQLFATQGAPIKPDETGALRDQDGKLVFLAGSLIARYPISLVQQRGKLFRGLYPDEYRFFYEELPLRDNMERMGFNTMVWESPATAFNVLFPDHEANKDRDPFTVYDEGIKKYGIGHSRNLWDRAAYDGLVDSIRSYRDFPSFANPWFYGLTSNHEQMKNILDTEKVLVHQGKHSRDIPVQLGSEEGVATLVEYYKEHARIAKQLGVTPLGYRVFTESRYHDYSPANQARFVERLKEKFETLEAMNARWRTSYSSFENAAKTNTDPKYKTIPASIEYSIMEQEQANAIGTAINDAIKEIQPESGAIIQILGDSFYRNNETNFHLNAMFKDLEYIATGTGNYAFSNLENADASTEFKDTPSLSPRLSDSPVREAFYRAVAKNRPMVNLEAYCAGPHYNAQKFNTVLWRELAVGRSAVIFHALEGLEADPQNKNPVSYFLLNPNSVQPTEFQGIHDMREASEQ